MGFEVDQNQSNVQDSSTRGWSILARIFLVILTVASAVDLYLLIGATSRYVQMLAVMNTGDVLSRSLAAYQLTYDWVALYPVSVSRTLFFIIPLLLAWLAWLLWQFHAQKQVVSLKIAGFQYKPFMGVVWWLVPGANLILPFKILQNMGRVCYKKLDPSAPERLYFSERKWSLLSVAWWVATLLALLGLVIFWIFWAILALEARLPAYIILLASDVFFMFSAYLGFQVVARIQRWLPTSPVLTAPEPAISEPAVTVSPASTLAKVEVGDTQPQPSTLAPPMVETSDTQPQPVARATRRSPRWVLVLGFFILSLIGIFSGYAAGFLDRLAAQAADIEQQVDEQFRLGVQEMEAGQYENAMARFQYVIQHASDYPGIQEKYTELLLRMSMSPTPTQIPSTPTPDLRGADALFAHAQQLINSGNWNGVIEVLDSLRKEDPTYRTVEVDGMYFIALRNRGVSKILNENCADINLEGGIYDLSLAERFGPLDGYSEGLRNFSRLYIIGATFWELDWVQAQNYFRQVYPSLPNLMDSSCKTATERYRYATVKYADQLLAANEWCQAYEQYNIALSLPSGENPAVLPTATYAAQKCYPPTRTPLPVTDTPIVIIETPTETPTATPP